MKKLVKQLLGLSHEPNIDRSKHKPALGVAPNLDHHRFLFVAGLHRSGTSVLHRLLRHNPSVSGIHDAGVPEDEGQFLQSVFPTGRFYGASGHFAFSPGAHLTEDSSLITEKNKDKLLREWGSYYDLGRPVFLEKSPPNIIRSRFFQKLFPGSKFVFILRHPVAVAMATQKWSGNSPIELLLHWYLAHRILFEDLGYLDDHLVFRYEDFVLDPQFYCDTICHFAKLPPMKAEEQVVNHNAKYLARWSKGFEGERHMLEEFLPNLPVFFDELGYGIMEPFTSDIVGRFIATSSGPNSGLP